MPLKAIPADKYKLVGTRKCRPNRVFTPKERIPFWTVVGIKKGGVLYILLYNNFNH